MTLLLTIVFFVAGGVCLTRPKHLIEWMTALAARMQGKDASSYKVTENQGVILFIRIIGLLSLINAVTLLLVSGIPIDSR